MDQIPLEIPPGPVTITAVISGIHNEQLYDIVVMSPGRNGPRVDYTKRVSGSEVTFNLPIHAPAPIFRVSDGVIEQYMVSQLRPPKIPYLEEPETSRPYSWKDIKFRTDFEMNTPARIFKQKPIIEHNPLLMSQYDEPTKYFIFLHEYGHLIYDTEDKADTWALVTFLNAGFNLSSAVYALSRVLKHTPDNVTRILKQHFLVKHINNFYYG